MTSGLGRAADARAPGGGCWSAQRVDVVAALGVAGLVNVSMLVVAAALFHGGPLDVDEPRGARTPGSALVAGGGAALAFAVALLASGLSSASVGTCAGEVVMRGLLRRRIPTGRCAARSPCCPRSSSSAAAWTPGRRSSSARSCCRSASRSPWCRSSRSPRGAT